MWKNVWSDVASRGNGSGVVGDGVLAVSSYFNPQVFLLYHNFPTMTINIRQQLIQLDLRRNLQASFVIVLDFLSKHTDLQKQSLRSFLIRIYLSRDVAAAPQLGGAQANFWGPS